MTFNQRIKILIGAALAAGLIGAGFGASTFMGNDAPSARGDSTPIDVPVDNSAEIDLDDDATEIPHDNSVPIDPDSIPGEDAVGDPDDDDISGSADEPGEDAVGDPDDGDVGGDEPGSEPVDEPGEEPGEEPVDEPGDEPGKCDLDPEAEGCGPKTPWNPDLDIVNPEDEKPDPPFPGNDLDIEAQPEDEDPEPDPDPVFNPDFDIKTEIKPTH